MRGMHDPFVLATLACLVVQSCRDMREGWHFSHVGGPLAGIAGWGSGWGIQWGLLSTTLHPPGDPPYAPQNYPGLSSNESMRGFQSRLDGSRQLPYTRACEGRGIVRFDTKALPALFASETSNSRSRYLSVGGCDQYVRSQLGPASGRGGRGLGSKTYRARSDTDWSSVSCLLRRCDMPRDRDHRKGVTR